jgi:hypothetical protein
MRASADLLQIIIRIAQSDSAHTESFNIRVGELVRTQLTYLEALWGEGMELWRCSCGIIFLA